MKYIFKNWKNRPIKFLILLLIFIFSCANTVSYENIMKKQIEMLSPDIITQLEKEKVIIIDPDFVFVDTTKIEDMYVSNVIISDSVVNDAEKRYIISHLIRNILIQDAVIYNYDEKGNNFTMEPHIVVGDDFIYENSNAICDVIYYIVHKDYFNFYGKPGGGFDKFFSSSLLEVISADLKHLKLKLKKENAFSEAPFAEIDIKQVLASLNSKDKEMYLRYFNLNKVNTSLSKLEALNGSGAYAYNISAYYAFLQIDTINECLWGEIAAENNNDVAQNDYARILEATTTKTGKIRSLYWLFKALKNGNYDAWKKIENQHLNLESSYPVLQEDIYKKQDTDISEYEIELLIDYALRGGKKEAYFLYEYYKNYKKNEKEALSWLRIGAQNDNTRCQYEYGQHFLKSNKEEDRIRGRFWRFWIKKAAKTGSAEAKKLLKEIGENENYVFIKKV
ncbi:sel1 repeat family protein [Treponema pedis]|uniref:sel1 repeat family protein n=1 Tax=Treponema pedis TaxID=409322 RepID=UPI00040AE461|nr:sel1 repeat family protein [Treponema pedis]